ncbi:hypothetical protein BDQ12DRAFT_674478 [Crucibulum laeve]|uniref:Uncharacterized protein n=1 Tax=Crucibulum laeve TaxID=68775 RepID=A0A5C3MFE0_9AGAR|nr:hypothetical protein BDQ12DRAFT_674478 [Crucibulum laeve]
MSRLSFAISLAHSVTRAAPRQILKSSSRPSSTLSISPQLSDIPSSSSSSPPDWTRYRVYEDLTHALSRGSSPSRVWAQYTSLLNFLGYEKLPLELHQEVLRRCTASTTELRLSAPRRLAVGNKPENPHIHEGRFQTVISNIRAMGEEPSLDDYHFILEQFAAVGHHVGVMQVFKEMTHLGLVPVAKTFGLCLQAIGHRLTLPIYKENLPRLVDQTQKMLADLMSDMRKYKVQFTPVNLDLTIRVLKETLDQEGLESLLKWGYGIDLANPDRSPLEYTDAGAAMIGIDPRSLPSPMPLSTAALNTIIDILGRLGDVSKLVQAFEVLTQPLPQANQHLFSSFDDDDDFGVAVDVDSAQPFIPPHAFPNTTTYNTLLRHICRSGHAILARHYLLQAIMLDREQDFKLRIEVSRVPHLENIPAPHFAINRGTLIPALGEGNRDKNVGLMRWLSTKLPRIIRKKKAALAFYIKTRDNQRRMEYLRQIKELVHSPAAVREASAFLPPSQGQVIGGSVITRTPMRVKTDPSVFDVDLNAPQLSPKCLKYLDLDLHINILSRDVREIQMFATHLANILGRTTQRMKERLGRRIWAERDIYLSSENKRVILSRNRWKEVVGFKPRKNDNQVWSSTIIHFSWPNTDITDSQFSNWAVTTTTSLRQGLNDSS